jgi:hypothetical protein
MNNTSIVNFLASELKQEIGIVQNALDKFYETQPLVFSTKKAKDTYDTAVAENKLKTEIKVGTGSNGKVTMDDIRKATGEVSKSQKVPSEWVSKAAEEEASKFGLTSADFDEDSRSGSATKAALASGMSNRIAIDDVRKRILIEAEANGDDTTELKTKFYSSPGVAQLAIDNELSPTDFDVKGIKITKKMVEEKIQAMVPANDAEEQEIVQEADAEEQETQNNPFDDQDEQETETQ